MTFKVGDRVTRTADAFHTTKRGESYTVAAVNESAIDLKGHKGRYSAGSFELASVQAGEIDPNGLDQHAPGAKVDAGKVRPSLILMGMARAVWAVCEVATMGAAKYTDGGWVLVPNGQSRYEDAHMRHMLKRGMGQSHDDESNYLHLAHEAWNALAKLDLHIRKLEKDNA